LYKNKKNPFLQEFQIEGRFQYQAAYLEGSDVNGRNYNETYDEYRRARIGVKAKFLQYFGAKVSLNMVDDGRNASPPADLDWGYSDFDEAVVSFDIGKALGQGPFDTLVLNYGRRKFTFSQEAHTSSTKLLTMERSAISNKVYGSYRPTGLSVDATKDDWTFGAAIYSSTSDGEDNEAFNGWQDSAFYYLNAGYKASDQLTLGADFVYNDADVAAGDDSVMDYAWAASLNATYDAGPWGIIGDVIYGDNGGSGLGHTKERSGAFWGAVVMPYYWLIEDKLQLVGQYQYQGSSEAEGSRVNSRYGRASVDTGIDVNSGRGDSHHSLYAGLNFYLCGDNAKIQAGVEYQTMDTQNGDFDTLTYVIGFRSFF
ncbi:MAG: hypothetical protein EOP83_19120, partial [Verrucomicrobiaceae bacterium]